MAQHAHWVCTIAFGVLLFLAWAPRVHAFGAGNIPSYAFLEGLAHRHGDIEDTLAELFRKGGAGFMGIGGHKFGGLDVKRVYFGNWLRDYSQAMDVAGLSKMSRQAIINLVMALGFLAHGYATAEFEVTEERLGVYLPVEHIDNPKDYNDNKDARQVHPGLRPPIQPAELDIDPHTGMKNYIANERGNWDTSAACVRRNMLRCIDFGRRARASGSEDELYEAYRLLGTFLHTLEDLSAHSNWCELMLQRLGHRQIFDHVGYNVRVRAPDGQMVAPLVTGTFGSSDFIHSLLGEAGDHISESSISDLSRAMDNARSAPRDGVGESLRTMLFELPGSTGSSLSRDLDGIEQINRGPSAKAPQDMSPQELHAVLWQVLTVRDRICMSIEHGMEKVPGLSSLVERITNAVNSFVLRTLDPYLRPIMSNATSVLQSGSAEVINNQNQYEVFDNPNASDPTHSLLAKDHFATILNEPAGELAKIVLRHTVRGVVAAWDNPSMDPRQVIDESLSAFHHPFFQQHTQIQRDMQGFMEKWIREHRDRDYILRALTKDEVRAGRNKRKGHYDSQAAAQGTFLPTPQGMYDNASNRIHSHVNNAVNNALESVPGYNQYQHVMGRRELDPGSADMRQPSPGPHGDATQQAYEPPRMGRTPPPQTFPEHRPHHDGTHGGHHGAGGRHGGPPPHQYAGNDGRPPLLPPPQWSDQPWNGPQQYPPQVPPPNQQWGAPPQFQQQQWGAPPNQGFPGQQGPYQGSYGY